MKKLVDEQVLTHKIPKINNDRQMKMNPSHEKIEVSIENLHKIQKERLLQEEAKAKKEDEFGNIMRALTLTKSNSKVFDNDPFTFDNSATPTTGGPIDLTTITNKEERGLYELLNSLNENLELLDSVKEVFERSDETGVKVED